MDEKYKLLGNFEKFSKIVDTSSIEKIEFLTTFGKSLLKIGPSEITSFFSNNFSISGGNVPYVPPGGAYGYNRRIFSFLANIGKILIHNGIVILALKGAKSLEML